MLASCCVCEGWGPFSVYRAYHNITEWGKAEAQLPSLACRMGKNATRGTAVGLRREANPTVRHGKHPARLADEILLLALPLPYACPVCTGARVEVSIHGPEHVPRASARARAPARIPDSGYRLCRGRHPTRYRPLHSGFRFSRYARIPSC